MADSVVRRDVIEIGFKVDGNPLNKLVAEVNQLKQSLGGVKDDGISKIAETAKKCVAPFNNLKEKIKSVVQSIKALGVSGVLSKLKEGLKSIAKTSLEKIVSGLKKMATYAGKAAVSLAKMVGKSIVTGVKALGAGLAAAATGFVALATGAIKGYAEYEQLVGGVETLFGKSSNDVIKNANNAYKTAGLSANAYMDTVTSFSASLLQSLGGDTDKAAKMADLAITDMADNANKMGTDMESIQNAYQGFAKQNYTMLDNLKLGYGGTKEEMERLLKDAEKITGKKFDLSSYADIVEAIHAVQTEMGITGTTAKEASTTIQGSFNSMRAAWTNFLTGMADPNQDFDALVGNLIDSVVTFGDNLIPRIQALLPRLVDGISRLMQSFAPTLPGILMSLLPTLASGAVNLVNSLISTIQSNLPQLSNMAVTIVTQLATFLLQALPQIMVIGLEIITSLCQGIAQQLPTLVPLAINAILILVNSMTQNLPLIIAAALQIINALVQGLSQNMAVIIQAAIQLIGALLQGLISALPQLIMGALQLVMALAMGLIQNLPLLIQTAVQLVIALIMGLVQSIPMIISTGLQLITGLVQGLIQNLPIIVQGALQIIVALAVGLIQAIPQLLMAIPQIFGAFIQGIFSVNWLQVGIDLFVALAQGIFEGIASIGSTIWNGIKGIFSGGDSTAEAAQSGVQTMDSYSSGLTSSTGISTATSSINTQLSTGLTTDLTGAGTSTIGTYDAGLTSGVQGITGVTTGIGEGIQTDLNLDLNTQGLGTMTTYDTGLTTGGATASTTASGTADDIKSTFDNLDLTSSGKNIMSGLISGMDSMRGAVISAAESIASAVSSTINKALDINSPSGVAEWQAQMVGKGLVGGLRKSKTAVQAASYDLSDAMYMPESSGRATASRSEVNNYSPQFVLNFSGNTDRTAERTVKQWVKDALNEAFASIERANPRVQEV